jgi:hypothetical protein
MLGTWYSSVCYIMGPIIAKKLVAAGIMYTEYFIATELDVVCIFYYAVLYVRADVLLKCQYLPKTVKSHIR